MIRIIDEIRWCGNIPLKHQSTEHASEFFKSIKQRIARFICEKGGVGNYLCCNYLCF